MINNILEYVVTTDVYYQLWMVAQATIPEKAAPFKRGIRHNNDNWHPALVGQFNDVRDVPSTIEIENGEHQLDGEARFHTGNNKPTLKADRIEIAWGSNNINTRANGPCKIVLSGVKFWHHQGELHRRRGDAIIIEQAKFQWNTRNSAGLYREFGPYQIIISRITGKAQVSGTEGNLVSHIKGMSFRKLQSSWANSNGVNLSESRVKQILTNHNIKVNYLLAGESVFADEGEEFIFWNELGGEL